MKTTINAIPGYKVFEYILVLNPHEELRHKILEVKHAFYEKFRAESAKWGQPHITLAAFTQYEMMEDRIINRLHEIAMGFPPIKVELKDYGSFPSHTIYINVTSKVPVQSLVKQVRTETQKLMKFDEDHKPYFIMDPHLTIARKLQPWQYEKGWLEFSHRHFTGKFIADGMLLLKRVPGELKYQVVQRFDFQNLPVTIKQGDLFG